MSKVISIYLTPAEVTILKSKAGYFSMSNFLQTIFAKNLAKSSKYPEVKSRREKKQAITFKVDPNLQKLIEQKIPKNTSQSSFLRYILLKEFKMI